MDKLKDSVQGKFKFLNDVILYLEINYELKNEDSFLNNLFHREIINNLCKSHMINLAKLYDFDNKNTLSSYNFINKINNKYEFSTTIECSELNLYIKSNIILNNYLTDYLFDSILRVVTFDKKLYDNNVKDLIKIADDSGLIYHSYKVIENGYNGNYYYVNKPWVIFKTYNGDIRIGWRKRVLEIEAKHSIVNFLELFKDEDVTKERNLIHAWPNDEVRYLKEIAKFFNKI